MPGGAGTDLQDWFRSLPFFTKYWFGGSVLFTLLGRFSLVNPYWLILSWETFITKFHIWRPITALFFYKPSFHWLINLYFLYNYSLRLETGIFDGRPADYCFMLAFNLILSVIIGLFLSFPVLMDPMVMSILYVWCQINKDTIVTFWFGTQFKAMYLPWVLFGMKFIMSENGGMMELSGILIGHMYFFLMFKYPQDFGGPSLLSTPDFLYRIFPNKRGGVSGYGQAPASAQQGGQGGGGGGGGGFPRPHQWGGGNRLGD